MRPPPPHTHIPQTLFAKAGDHYSIHSFITIIKDQKQKKKKKKKKCQRFVLSPRNLKQVTTVFLLENYNFFTHAGFSEIFNAANGIETSLKLG